MWYTSLRHFFFNNTDVTKKKVYEHYNIPAECKLILYAPTFRSNKPSDFLGMDFKRLKDAMGNKYVIGEASIPTYLNQLFQKE